MPLCSLRSSGEMHAGERLKETSIKCFIKVLSHWKLPEQFVVESSNTPHPKLQSKGFICKGSMI